MTRGEFERWWCGGCEKWISTTGHTCVGIGSGLKLAVAAGLVIFVSLGLAACNIPPASEVSSATVTGTEAGGDRTVPGGLTHYADCTDTDGTPFRVIVDADTEYKLRAGQRCPDGPHLPTARQQNPGLFDQIQSALTQPLPYNGGDPNGPCGSWAAADKADADRLRDEYDKCMASHH